MINTRARLVTAARECLHDHGLAGATSRNITAAAGANLGAITYHFGSKDELVAEALVGSLRDWLDPTIEMLSGDGDPATRTLGAVQNLVTTFEQRRGDAVVFLEAIVQSLRSPGLRRAVVALWADLRRGLAAEIQRMQAAGQVPDWVDPPTMAALLVAVAHGLVVQVSVDTDGPALPELAGQFGQLLLVAGSGAGRAKGRSPKRDRP